MRAYATEAAFTPWSGTGPVDVSSPAEEFEVTSGRGWLGVSGSRWRSRPGFLTRRARTSEAGAFTGFELELSRPDGDQALERGGDASAAGIAALLSSVTLCSEAQASADACPAESRVGDATAIAGLGSEPYVENGGKVYHHRPVWRRAVWA